MYLDSDFSLSPPDDPESRSSGEESEKRMREIEDL